MNKICSVPVNMWCKDILPGSKAKRTRVIFKDDVDVYIWTDADDFPKLGKSVGIDTETELIRKDLKDPPVVVLGCFDPEHKACYLVMWRFIPKFMEELCRRNIEQRYFNLGFDEMVISNELKEAEKVNGIKGYGMLLIEQINAGYVKDMLIRLEMHDIATIGFIRHSFMNLKGCAGMYLNMELDKGDGTENSARLSFKRFNNDGTDYSLTDDQIKYLPYDCISTWGLGEAVPEKDNSEFAHTKGMCVLAHIEKNGFPVDEKVRQALISRLTRDMDVARDKLIAYGFPDPYKEDEKLITGIKEGLVKKLSELSGLVVDKLPKKDFVKAILIDIMDNRSLAGIKTILSSEKVSIRKKDYEEFEVQHPAVYRAMSRSLKSFGMHAFLFELIRQIEEGKEVEEAEEAADAYMASHPEWRVGTEKKSPHKDFQERIAALIEKNPGLYLETQEKSNDLKLTKKDIWRLDDLGIKDGFLDTYIEFNHCRKYLSTYMKPEYIAPDGKVHTRFTNLLKTGRTASTNPNIQNLPSREKVYPLKYMFTAPPGAVLCATDFDFAELVALAQASYSKFGFSVLMQIINANIDPHYWFAGIMLGIIDSDLSQVNDPKWVEELVAKLKKEVPKTARQTAKIPNFGLPGGLSARSFWTHCREEGLKIEREESDHMRDLWIQTFKEFNEHMKCELDTVSDRYIANQWNGDIYGEEEEASAEFGSARYMVKNILGMERVNCTLNSAANFKFQSLVAAGAKLAGWNLLKHGYGDRLLCFIHDEYLYWLYPEELDENIPIIEELMKSGMSEVMKDVRVGAETTVCTHWDKGAKTLDKLEKVNGRYIIEYPEFVKEVYKEQGK